MSNILGSNFRKYLNYVIVWEQEGYLNPKPLNSMVTMYYLVILSRAPQTTLPSPGSVSRLLSTLDILLPSGVLQCCLRAYSGVPVDSNTGFYQWMQTAHQAKDPEKPENRQVSFYWILQAGKFTRLLMSRNIIPLHTLSYKPHLL